MAKSPTKVWLAARPSLVSRAKYATKNRCGAGRFALPQPRVAHEFSWQSFACAVAVFSLNSGESAIHQTPHLVARDQECRKAGGKQKNPRGVTHSFAVLKSRHHRGTVPMLNGLRSVDHRGKAKGAPSREKWEQGGECGTSQGACAERELSMRPETALLGQELGGRATDTLSGRKGFSMGARQKSRAAA